MSDEIKSKEFICWYCGEIIEKFDFCYTDNDGKKDPTHIHCAQELGISYETEDGIYSDEIEEFKEKHPDLDYDEIIEGLRDDSLYDEDEKEQEEDKDEDL